MHKLLLRQLKHHLGVSQEAIPGDLLPFLEAVNLAYVQSDEDLQMIERSLEISSREMIQRNEEITKTLDNLRSTQGQLIHSAKMAGLGQLVAGVSHEINTPAAAIQNAIEEIKNNYNDLFQAMVVVVNELSEDLQPVFFKASGHVMGFNEQQDTLEQRKIAKAMEEKLVKFSLPEPATISKNLVQVGFSENTLFLIEPLIKSPVWPNMYDFLFKLGMSLRHIKNIQVAVSRIISLVKALKLHSHSGNEQVLGFSNLKEDIESTLMILHNRLKRGIEVVREFEEIPQVRCYSDQLNQVWTNLVNNAAEAMNFKGTITIRLKNLPDKKVEVQVEDDGPGFAPMVLNQLFHPYVTTKPKGEGTGLGLSICKTIVDTHKGDIRIKETRPGKTLISVVIPVEFQGSENT